jgi:small-conductance mechanosensitive channel
VRTWDLRRVILPITYFVEKPFQNWSRVSTELLGTVTLHLDYGAPMADLRKELKRLVENNPKWDRRVCGLQVTDSKETTIEVRALVSAADPAKMGDLRCEIREGLIEFLWRNHPESLPRNRTLSVDEVSGGQRRKRSDDATATPGAEHERGDKSPGVQSEVRNDGAAGEAD